jgi:hypothetical protein
MAIEKVFAIEAEPGLIWDALWSELTAGEAAAYTVEQSNRPRLLALRVAIGGLPSLITYEIAPKDGYCEVAASLQPLSARYNLLQFLTLGRLRTEYNLMLAQGLANLKQAVEGDNEEPETED